MRITVIVDNFARQGYDSEFGLSLLLEHQNRTILFDTGAGNVLAGNLKRTGIHPEEIKEIILSHGHCDHTGGLAQLAPETIFCSPEITEGHFSLHTDSFVHDITMPSSSKEVLHNSDCRFISEFTDIGNGLLLSGKIPRISNEDCGGKFFHDSNCSIVDNICDEQFLLTSDGILISGCCHAGIINSLCHAGNVHPEISVNTILGGLHLSHASNERLQETADFIFKRKIKNLYLLHCTGENAIEQLKNLLPDCNIHTLSAGDTVVL